MEHQKHDFMPLYTAWEQLSKGQKAELRRVTTPERLIEVPAFYRLFSGKATKEWERRALQRLIFCLPFIRHTNEKIGLGAALATRGQKGKGAISEKRLFQVIRSDSPNDMIQLRRILKTIEPVANWPLAAAQVWYWNERSKRDLLEDFFLNQVM